MAWPQSLPDAVCALHPANPASDTCSRCGRFVCLACSELQTGETYCDACYARQFGGKASSRAVTALVLAILGLNCGPFLGIPAVIVAQHELAAIDAGMAPEKGRPLARGAQILGWIEIGLTVLAIIIGVALFALS